MTLGRLIELHRQRLADESVGMRRSWEEMFRYTLMQYPAETDLGDFDVDQLMERLISAGLHRPIVEGYGKRWRELLSGLGKPWET